jgi:hypothetical protein
MRYHLFEKFLKMASIFYFVVGLIQTFTHKEFMLFLLNSIRTSENRGVTSLTVEPTFYGLVCLFLILIFLSLDVQNKNKYIYLLLFQIIFLSQSTMTILLLSMYGLYYFIFKINFKKIVLVLVFLFLFLASIEILNSDIINQNTRFFELLKLIIDSPSKILTADQSINFRLADIYFSFKGFIDNYMIPNGFGTYQAYITSELTQQTAFTGGSGWVTGSNRISSYYGSILFELGFVGLIIPLTYSYIIKKAYRYQIRDFLLNLFFINTVLLTAVPLSFTFVGIYLATLMYINNKRPKVIRLLPHKIKI